MLKLCRVTKLKVFFPVLVYVFNFDLFEFSATILEKGLLEIGNSHIKPLYLVVMKQEQHISMVRWNMRSAE